MVFTILLILITLLYIAVLELSKNILLEWCIAIGAAIALYLGRFLLRRKGIWNRRYAAFLWGALLLIFIFNYILTAPPYKNVPAVDNENPDVTEVVHVAQGDLTGVYNEDHSAKVYAGIPYAAAPVGELRFREPQAPESWDGVRACDEFGPMAMQARSNTFYDNDPRSFFEIM